MKRRLSPPLRPGSVRLPRQCGSILAHWASVKTNRSDPKLESHAPAKGNPKSQQALVHDSGLVSARRLTEGNTMPVRWRGRDMFQLKDEAKKRLPRDQKFVVQPEDVGIPIFAEDVIRERIYKVGDKIDLSPTDLAEIIFFYQILAMTVGACMHAHPRVEGMHLSLDQSGKVT